MGKTDKSKETAPVEEKLVSEEPEQTDNAERPEDGEQDVSQEA